MELGNSRPASAYASEGRGTRAHALIKLTRSPDGLIDQVAVEQESLRNVQGCHRSVTGASLDSLLSPGFSAKPSHKLQGDATPKVYPST